METIRPVESVSQEDPVAGGSTGRGKRAKNLPGRIERGLLGDLT
jgi:hypothetical protein